MLIEFRAVNHRSIREEQVLTMEVGRGGGSDDSRPRELPGAAKKILPVAAIYGANASGKTNVLLAMTFMRDCVSHSLRNWPPDGGIPRDPFAWGNTRAEPTTLEIEFIVQGIRYRYGFMFDEKVFIREWLHAWPNAKKQVWFERIKETFTFGPNLRGENKVIEEVTRPNALFLSAAAQLRHGQLTPLYNWFNVIESFKVPNQRYDNGVPDTEFAVGVLLEEAHQPTLFGDRKTQEFMLDGFKALVRNADFGIVDVRASRRDGTRRPFRIEFKHQSNSADSWLSLSDESRGTQTLFRLALPALRVLYQGSVLLVDELESSMHPNLAEHIVRLFNEPRLNSKNAQLIFTTHDTNLLGTVGGTPPLRRDQVWLTEKDSSGATVLYPLTDFKPRKEENVERGYIQGRYGAIPYLGNFRIEAE